MKNMIYAGELLNAPFKMETKLPIALTVRIRYTEDMWQVCCGRMGEIMWGKGYAWQGQ